MSDIKEIVIESFELNTGIFIDNYENTPLKDLPLESLKFINFIVDIESKFSIILPEDYLLINELPDLITFTRIIENLYEINNRKEYIDTENLNN